MAMRLERDDRSELEQRVERLENTLRAVARQSNSITIRGPCRQCQQCLLFSRNDAIYCPHCGDGQTI